jgi:hypothetical protein
VILVVPGLPASILRELELAEIAKSGGPARVTAIMIVVMCETNLLVPVMVTV